jgi:hypothetical protein
MSNTIFLQVKELIIPRMLLILYTILILWIFLPFFAIW